VAIEVRDESIVIDETAGTAWDSKEAAFMRPEVLKSVGDMWGYLRISQDQQHSRIRLVPNLMNSYFRATVFEDPVSDIVHVISGPYSKQADIPLTVVHELLHTVIGSTLDQQGL
jgi:hypothetical protein